MAYLNITTSDDLAVDQTNGNTSPSITSVNSPFVSYKPIGIGKPLSIQIMTIYTGSFPQKKGLFKDNKPDLLCVSGVKAFETFTATPRAINVLQHHVAEKSYIEFSTFAAATPYIYYKKAVDDEIEFTVELSINTFDNDLINSVCNLFGKAAGLPVFMPGPGKLLSSGNVTDLLQSGANELFKPSTLISQTIPIQFNTAGMPISVAQSIFVYPSGDQHDAEFADYHVETKIINGSPQMQLTNKDGAYNGDSPYIIINLDGNEKPELESWSATLTSSSMLSEFYSGNGGSNSANQDFNSAMQLYSDYRYFSKAATLANVLKSMNPDDIKYSETSNLYQAFIANISKASPFASQLPTSLPSSE